MSNMFDSKDMLKVFGEGISAEQLAKDFQDALNAAIAEKKKADEAAAKAKAEAEAAAKRKELQDALQKAKDMAKMREADDIAARLCAFLKTHYGNAFPQEAMPTIKGADLISMVDEAVKMGHQMAELDAALKDFAAAFGVATKDENGDNKNTDKCVCKPVTASRDPIADFLRKNGLM